MGMKPSPGARRALCWLLGGSLALSAILLFVVLPAIATMATPHYAIGFADDYHLLAYSLMTGEGYRLYPGLAETMMREPGYPLFLAGAFTLLGFGLETARLANLVLAGLTAFMVWRLALRVTRNELAGLVAAAIFLLHPGTLIAEGRGGVEILFMFAVMAFILLLYRAIYTDRGGHYLLAGLVLGAAVLIRSTPLLFPLALAPPRPFLFFPKPFLSGKGRIIGF